MAGPVTRRALAIDAPGDVEESGGASATPTRLGSAKAPEPRGLGPTGAIPSAFTPGPWRAGIEGNNRVYGPDCAGEHTGLIAVVYKGAANKCLIAAAPKLHAAAQAAFEFLGGIDGAAAVRDQLVEALLDAEGGAHDL